MPYFAHLVCRLQELLRIRPQRLQESGAHRPSSRTRRVLGLRGVRLDWRKRAGLVQLDADLSQVARLVACTARAFQGQCAPQPMAGQSALNTLWQTNRWSATGAGNHTERT